MEEIWKDIKGYEKVYQVSNLGRVRSLDRYVEDINKTQFIKGRTLKPLNNGNNYLEVHLRKDNARKKRYIHRLVAEAFINNYGEEKEVNHKDFNTKNNNVYNLEMVTAKENFEYSNKRGRYKEARKITANKAIENTKEKKNKYKDIVLELYIKKQMPVEQINKYFGISEKVIYAILKENNVNVRGYKVVNIAQIKDGEILLIHDSYSNATRWLIEHNYTTTEYASDTISDCVKGKRKEAYGFCWKLI